MEALNNLVDVSDAIDGIFRTTSLLNGKEKIVDEFGNSLDYYLFMLERAMSSKKWDEPIENLYAAVVEVLNASEKMEELFGMLDGIKASVGSWLEK